MRFGERTVHGGGVHEARVARWGRRGSGIKSVQRGSISIAPAGGTSATATIVGVDLNNARLKFTGQKYNSQIDNSQSVCGRLALTNATTVTLTVNTSPANGTLDVFFEVIEYYPGVIRYVQRGTIAAPGTDTLAQAVATASAEVDNLGFETPQASIFNSTTASVTLTNTTTVTSTANHVGTVGYQVVDWHV